MQDRERCTVTLVRSNRRETEPVHRTFEPPQVLDSPNKVCLLRTEGTGEIAQSPNTRIQ